MRIQSSRKSPRGLLSWKAFQIYFQAVVMEWGWGFEMLRQLHLSWGHQRATEPNLQERQQRLPPARVGDHAGCEELAWMDRKRTTLRPSSATPSRKTVSRISTAQNRGRGPDPWVPLRRLVSTTGTDEFHVLSRFAPRRGHSSRARCQFSLPTPDSVLTRTRSRPRS